MTKQCTEINNLYDDVPHCPGQISLPGVREHFYWLRRSEIIKWPVLPMNGAETLEENPVYKDDFVLAADSVWHRADLIPNESEPKSEQAGVYGSLHFSNQITLVLPGTGPKVTGLINELNNDDVVILVPQRDGHVRVFGNQDFQTTIKPSQAWGKGSSDSSNTTISVTIEDKSATPFYNGKIHTADGDVSGETDELIVASPPANGQGT
ncbi:MAG: hypothetical protein LKE54_04525 [Prevotella sp.]|jgi:hypothetical protein|nr:hypothetical protein [Prevotella sp.]MCH3994308.1 hypothetical protein [Prevotella sp.]